MSTDLIQVQTTVDCSLKAKQLANQLVEAKLVACVQISRPVSSVYVWDGQVCQQEEYVLVGKTIRAAWPELVKLLQQVHPYDEPQIIALPIVQATDSFANWVTEQIKVV